MSVVWCLMSGCGFHPVYGKQDNNISAKLASVRVENIPGRSGQVLEYQLVDLLNPNNMNAGEDYTIKIKWQETRRELGIKDDLRVTRFDIVQTAVYQLISLNDNREVDKGTVTIKSSFNRTISEFSTYVAQGDASEKAARELAQEIRSRLIYYFSK
jgi:LPS-assembly lipoprotein